MSKNTTERGRLCAHADEDGRGMHVLQPGERCLQDQRQPTNAATERTTTVANLPPFETMCSQAYLSLGNVEDELRSDATPGDRPTREQLAALLDARSHIALAKAALMKAARA